MAKSSRLENVDFETGVCHGLGGPATFAAARGNVAPLHRDHAQTSGEGARCLNFYDPFNRLIPLSFAGDMVALAGGATHDLSGMGLLHLAGTFGTLITGAPDASEPLVLGQWEISGAVAVSDLRHFVLLGIACSGSRHCGLGAASRLGVFADSPEPAPKGRFGFQRFAAAAGEAFSSRRIARELSTRETAWLGRSPGYPGRRAA